MAQAMDQREALENNENVSNVGLFRNATTFLRLFFEKSGIHGIFYLSLTFLSRFEK